MFATLLLRTVGSLSTISCTIVNSRSRHQQNFHLKVFETVIAGRNDNSDSGIRRERALTTWFSMSYGSFNDSVVIILLDYHGCKMIVETFV